MKLIEFGSRNSFYKWFYKNDRSDDYPLTDFNYRRCWEEDTHIYRCVEKGKDVGVIFIICYGPGKMWIDLFEVKEGKYRTGIGTEMFRLLMEKHTPLYVKLECVEEEDKEKQAHHFWRKMGVFECTCGQRYRFHCTVMTWIADDNEFDMYLYYKAKECTNWEEIKKQLG